MNNFAPLSSDLPSNYSVLIQAEYFKRNRLFFDLEIKKSRKKIQEILNFKKNNKDGYKFETQFSNFYGIRKSRSVMGEIEIRKGFNKIKKKLKYKNFSEEYIKYIESLKDDKGIIRAILKPDYKILVGKGKNNNDKKTILLELKNSTKGKKKKQYSLYLLETILKPNQYEGIVYIINSSDSLYKDKNGILNIGFNYILKNNINTIKKLTELILKENGNFTGNENIHYYKK